MGHRRFALGIVALAAGSKLGERAHLGSAEMIYLLKGRLVLRLDGRKCEQSGEAAAYFPHSHSHAIDAAERTSMLQLFVPAGPERRVWGKHASGK